jgi:RNA-directed DNA polymerase
MMVLSPRARLFSASNTAEVSALLQVKSTEINYLVSRLGRQYARRSRKKPDGTKRVLLVPSERLKRLQRKVYDHILIKVPLQPCVYAVKGKSPKENAAVHTGKTVIFKMDLAQCFPSIKPQMVRDIFQGLGFGPEATGLLTKLTTWENELPQGVPTSSALANLALRRVDMRITKLKDEYGFDYSRWVDDLTFSGGARLLKFRGLLKKIIETEGFRVKAEKTETELAKDRQTVLNFVVNTKVNLPKEKRSAIKKEVMDAHGAGAELSASLAGKMYWLRSVNPEAGGRLVSRVAGK